MEKVVNPEGYDDMVATIAAAKKAGLIGDDGKFKEENHELAKIQEQLKAAEIKNTELTASVEKNAKRELIADFCKKQLAKKEKPVNLEAGLLTDLLLSTNNTLTEENIGSLVDGLIEKHPSLVRTEKSGGPRKPPSGRSDDHADTMIEEATKAAKAHNANSAADHMDARQKRLDTIYDAGKS